MQAQSDRVFAGVNNDSSSREFRNEGAAQMMSNRDSTLASKPVRNYFRQYGPKSILQTRPGEILYRPDRDRLDRARKQAVDTHLLLHQNGSYDDDISALWPSRN